MNILGEYNIFNILTLVIVIITLIFTIDTIVKFAEVLIWRKAVKKVDSTKELNKDISFDDIINTPVKEDTGNINKKNKRQKC